MNYINDIPLKVENNFNVIVEIPKGTDSKYELIDGSFDDVVEVRKVIGKYPFYYGCFPQTHAGDNDPLDMILITKHKHRFKPLDIIRVDAVGVIKTIDNGEVDDKIIVIPAGEQINWTKQLARDFGFLETYKGENSNTIINKNLFREDMALKLIDEAHYNYNKLNSSKIISE